MTIDLSYLEKQCTVYRQRVQDALSSNIHHLSQTKHITAVIGLLLSTMRWRWTRLGCSSGGDEEDDETLETSYDDVFLHRRLLDELYALAHESKTAEEAYLTEWYRFLRLSRQVLNRMEKEISERSKMIPSLQSIETIEEIEEIEEID